MPHKSVTVAGQIENLGPAASGAQQFLYHVIVRLRPMPAFLPLAIADHIPDEIDVFRLIAP